MRRRPLHLAFRVLLFLALPGAAAAQEELTPEEAVGMSLEELMTVDVATGTPRTRAAAPAITTVVTAEEIRSMGATTLVEVLESVPGLHVSRNSVYEPNFLLRGFFSDIGPYVLLLVDGLPATQYFGGSSTSAWGGMGVASIARVEILRGPGSAVFGADAMAGVVNVVTKGAEGIAGTEIGVLGGSFETRGGWLLHGGKLGGFETSLTLEARSTDGHRGTVTRDGQSSRDQAFGTSVSFAPGGVSTGADAFDVRFDLARGPWRLGLGYQDRNDIGLGAGVDQTLDPVGRGERERLSSELTWKRGDTQADWDFEVRLGFRHDTILYSSRLTPPGSFNGVGFFPQGTQSLFGWEQEYWRFDAAAVYDGFERHRLRFGAGLQESRLYDIVDRRNVSPFGMPLPSIEDFANDPRRVFGLPASRTDRFAFAQDEWRLAEGWELTAGLRWDRYSDFGDTLNPRLALVWTATERLTAKLLFGRAFRTPAYREQHIINNFFFRGNPDLKPEVMGSGELGFVYRPRETLELAANLFAYRLEDVILLTGRPPSLYRNSGERRGRGFELEARWTPRESLALAGSYAYQDTVDAGTDEDVPHVPRGQVYLRSDWRFQGTWHLATVLNHVAGRKRAPADPRPPIGDDLVVDLVLRREHLWPNVDLRLVGKNVFDEDAREPSLFVPGPLALYIADDLPLAGRSFVVELRYTFR